MSDKTKKKLPQGEWPDPIRSRDELDVALQAGEESGVSERDIDEIFEATIARVKNG